MATDAQGGLGGLGGFTPDASNAFLTQAYQSLLGRPPESSAIQSWQTANQMPSDLIDSIMGSQEYRNKQIPLMYQADLGRPADDAGASYWLNSGLNLDQINSAMQGSKEGQTFQQMMGSTPLDPNTPAPSWQQVVFPSNVQPGNTASSLMDYYTQAFTQMGAKDPTSAAAALIGNFGVEAPGLDPSTVQKGGGGGYGLAQWTDSSRKAGLTSFAQGLGLDPGSLEAQAKYPLQEMTTDPYYRKVALNPLLSATDPRSAMDAALAFEAPSGYSAGTPSMSSHYDWRTANMMALLAAANNNGGTSGMTPDQLSRFLTMQGQAATAPTPTPRPTDLNTPLPDVPAMTTATGDPRTDMINNLLGTTQTGLNDTSKSLSYDPTSNLQSFSSFFSPPPFGLLNQPTFGTSTTPPNFFSTPTYGSSGTYGQPNNLSGGDSSGLPVLTIPNPNAY